MDINEKKFYLLVVKAVLEGKIYVINELVGTNRICPASGVYIILLMILSKIRG